MARPTTHTVHVALPEDDAARLDALAAVTGRSKSLLAALAVNWWVRHPSLAGADEGLLKLLQDLAERPELVRLALALTARAPDDVAALLELVEAIRKRELAREDIELLRAWASPGVARKVRATAYAK